MVCFFACKLEAVSAKSKIQSTSFRHNSSATTSFPNPQLGMMQSSRAFHSVLSISLAPSFSSRITKLRMTNPCRSTFRDGSKPQVAAWKLETSSRRLPKLSLSMPSPCRTTKMEARLTPALVEIVTAEPRNARGTNNARHR